VALATLDRVTYRYPGATAPALSDASLRIDGGLTLVAGPSGGGKSTLLRVFNGLVPHFHGGTISGRATVAGLDVISTPTSRLAREVGFVFQDPELQAVYGTVEKEVAFGLENAAVPAHEIPGRVDEALHGSGVSHLSSRPMRTLSGGERQRVAIASALASRPRLVVLDEPTSQLDPEGSALVLSALREIARDGRSVVASEHRLRELMGAATQLVEVADARVRAGDPRAWMAPAAPPRLRRMAASGANAWSIRRVSVGFDSPVLEDVDVAGGSGEVVALSGPNGGGKTTLLRLIAGLLEPRSGAVERRPGRIAYLPQNPAALLHLPSVLDEVRFTLRRAGEAAERPESILEELGLVHVADRYPRDLSSGERERAAAAAVLPGAPVLVLLDEPTRGMDTASRLALVAVIGRLRDRGAAIVVATHDEELRAAIADRVLEVRDCRIVERPRAEVAGK
jgi:energy-coupling factor transporter ATP-binding protein EcfA2